MKSYLAFFLLLASVMSGAHAAPLGPDVAVLQIRIGKAKELQRVVIGLHDGSTPVTVANFKELVRKKFYNGQRFHRVFPGAFVQAGDPSSRHGQADRTGTGGPGYTIPAEIKLPHAKGSVAMARLPDDINPAKNSNGSQFYACLKPLPKLDGQYTVFGEILEGLDVLDYISNQPTNSNDFPLPKIVIKSIVIEPRVAPPANQ
ncbi:MAG: peptidylprolyl isomerase [Terrimicrobiaceae bacterium]|jgi:cyclophilin family peptidyl-prolyl cis-trans isomerase|nr:peptidylprolyl isomerase [Terrimicrobiaceae bacterium]